MQKLSRSLKSVIVATRVNRGAQSRPFTTKPRPAVAQLATQFICVLVDADEEPQLCQRLQLAGYPTLVIISPAGSSLGRLTGWQEAPALAHSLQAALQRYAVLEQPLRR